MTHLMISTYSNVFRILTLLNILRALSDLRVYIEFAHSYIHRKKCQESLKSLVRKNQAVQCSATLNVKRRRGRNPNWRRLDELRFEFSEPPRSIEVAVHPPSLTRPLAFLSIGYLLYVHLFCKILRDRALAIAYMYKQFDLLLSIAGWNDQ